jgi:hypothetical protein
MSPPRAGNGLLDVRRCVEGQEAAWLCKSRNFTPSRTRVKALRAHVGRGRRHTPTMCEELGISRHSLRWQPRALFENSHRRSGASRRTPKTDPSALGHRRLEAKLAAKDDRCWAILMEKRHVALKKNLGAVEGGSRVAPRHARRVVAFRRITGVQKKPEISQPVSRDALGPAKSKFQMEGGVRQDTRD